MPQKMIDLLIKNNCKKKRSFGFTLIELLVVIAILGIITIVVIAVFSEAKAKSRDSRRVSDIKTLHNALAMYVDKYNFYPVANVAPPGIAIDGNDIVSQALKNEKILLSNIVDPRASQVIGGEVFNYYYYTDSNGRVYTLTYCLETGSINGLVQGCGNKESY